MIAHQFDDHVDGLTYCSRCGLWDGVANHPLYRCTPRRPHIVDGEFQSDKYPTTPRGKVPLSVKDATAQDLLWQYAQRRRAVDAEFADDLEYALTQAGYQHATPVSASDPMQWLVEQLAKLTDEQLDQFEALIRASISARAQTGGAR